MKTTTQTNHYFWIDIARVIATFLVIVNHINEQLNFTVINNSTMVFQFVGRMGVPIFLGITGYLMINRNYTNKLKIERFSKNNLIPIVYSSIFWTIIFALYSYFNMLSNTDELLKNLIFQQRPLPQMWYIQILPVVYALLPIIAIAKQFIPKYLNGIFIAGTFILSIGNFTSDYSGGKFIPFQWNMSGSWALVFIMLALILLGSYIDPIVNTRKYTWMLFMISAITLGGFLLIISRSSKQQILSSFWYDQPLIFVFGFMSILFIYKVTFVFQEKGLTNELIKNVFYSLGKLTYGVYIVHYIVIIYLVKFLSVGSGIKSTMVISIITTILSFVLVFLINKIPKLPKFIFLTKK